MYMYVCTNEHKYVCTYVILVYTRAIAYECETTEAASLQRGDGDVGWECN